MKRILLFCTSSLTLCSAPAFAQRAAEAADQAQTSVAENSGEIVVTATRSAQVVSRVPISISAYNQASLDKTGVRDVAGIVAQTPGLVFQTTSRATNIAIRGISSTAGAATTGIYIDDTPIQIRSLGYGGGNAYPIIFDLDRVEVLRGPQGTLFGAGSEGGTVRFITPKPDMTRQSGYLRSELAFTESGAPSYEAGAALGGPLVADKIAYRASGYYRRNGGYVDRRNFDTKATVSHNDNWDRSYAGRLALAFAPSETLTITPSIFYQNTFSHGSSFYWDSLSDPDAHRYINDQPGAEPSHDEFYLPALNVDYDMGPMRLVANASYFDRSTRNTVDYTTLNQSLFTGISLPSIPGQHAESNYSNTQKNYTGELRLQSNDADARLRWVVGGFWSRNRQTAQQQVADTYFPTYILSTFGAPYTAIFGQSLVDGHLIYDQVTRSVDSQYAIFGEATYRIVEGLSFTAGLRYSHTKFEISALAQGPVVGPKTIDSGVQKENPVTPKFGLNYQFNRNNLVYVTVSKGFRPGGYNPAVGLPCNGNLVSLGLTDRPPLYNSDSVWSYEVGSKNKAFGGKVQLAASAYQVDWNSIQQNVFLNSCGFQFTGNLGSVRSRGFDLDVQVNVTPNLLVSAAVGYTNATFQKTVFGGPSATSAVASAGDAVVAPPWTVALHGEYTRPVLDGHEGYLRLDYNFKSHQAAMTPGLNPANGIADPTIDNVPATHLLSLRTGLRLNGIDVSAFVNNLLDDNAWIARQRDNTRSTLYRSMSNRPRTWGMTASYRF